MHGIKNILLVSKLQAREVCALKAYQYSEYGNDTHLPDGFGVDQIELLANCMSSIKVRSVYKCIYIYWYVKGIGEIDSDFDHPSGHWAAEPNLWVSPW